MSNLFAYGTLMCPDIMTKVTGLRLSSSVGTLLDYRRHAVRGADYPGIVACTGASVSGLLYRHLSAKSWRRLDRFEDAMYARRRVTIELVDGQFEQAETYIVKPAYVSQLEAFDWEFEHFLEHDKSRFLRNAYR